MSSTVGQVMTVAGLGLQVPLPLSQNGTPLQRSPSSVLAQSPSVLHVQTWVPALQLPLAQVSEAVQGSPSSHSTVGDGAPLGRTSIRQVSGVISVLAVQICLLNSTAVGLHVPVASAHAFTLQAVSAPFGQVTTVAGFTVQTPFCLLQNSVPLQALPSSAFLQSLSAVHAQVSVPPAHKPPWQTSAVVHASPSSQPLP